MIRRFGACCILFFASTATADEPAGTIQHTVKQGDTCAGIAQQYYGDARLVELLHKANPAIGALPPPHNLKDGTIMIVPPKPNAASSASGSALAPDAQLTTVRNHVDVLTPETKTGKPNDPLFRGNRVSTQEASAADVTFRDETQVKLGERTLVIILGDSRAAAAKQSPAASETQTSLVTGNLRAFMSSPRRDGAIAVATPAANVRVFRGVSQVSSDAQKTTRLAVYDGSSTISSQNRTREVTRGFGAKAEMGREPSAPRPLPSAPVWTSVPAITLPMPFATDDLAAAMSVSIVGEYDSETGTAKPVNEWHVQVARDEAFREVVADAKAPPAIKRLEIQAPGPGHYYARVSAIDDDRFEGSFSTVARFLVVRTKSTPITREMSESAALGLGRTPLGRRIEIEPIDAYCMRIGNVPLTWVKEPFDVGPTEAIRLRCAPSPADPTTLIRVDVQIAR